MTPKQTARQRERRAWARANGFCGGCRTRRASPGLKTCETCLANKYDADRRRELGIVKLRPVQAKPRPTARAKVRTPEQVARHKAAMRERYERLKLDGRCVRCAGMLLDDEQDSLHCAICAELIAAWNRTAAGKRSNAKRKARARALHRAAGLCLDCLKPPMANNPRCEDCLETTRLAQSKYTAKRDEARRIAREARLAQRKAA